MAFHVACPITCRRICFCSLGFPEKLQSEKARKGFLEEVIRVEEFLRDPWLIRSKGSGDGGTVEVVVPRVVPPPPQQPPPVIGDGEGFGGGGGGDGEELLSRHSKRVALQKRAFEASLAAEDYARRIESGVLVDIPGDTCDAVGEDQGIAAVKIMCRICFCGENEGGKRAARMLACKLCNKKYHRSCLKSWGQNRDLFHLSSWVCPLCRTCEICRRTGDSTKFMFCKRCDGAYHCYCQQPPHKNVSYAPYLCPKHTRCHSCGSNVPGNGPSTRWFLSYTCCDACGRLFVKGNYCPVCLKVYRDSESTPMVCCDVCQRWVHCQCDGISDEKYLEFQANGNLYYKCAACRGDCYQVQDDVDAVQELWRRRDKADKDQIASLRAAAGLPSHEDTFSISPYSDDEDDSPIKLKHEYGRSLKFSVKGSAHKTVKSTKEYGKKSSNKKYGKKKSYQVPSIEKTKSHHFESLNEGRSFEFSLSDEKNDDIRSYKNEAQEMLSSPIAKSPGNTRERCSINRAGVMKQDFVQEAVVSEDRPPRVLHIKSSKSNGSELGDGTGKYATKSETVRGTKLVIHLGGRNRNATNSPRSEASSCHREQDLTTSNGSEDTGQQKTNDKKFMDERQDGTARLSDSQGEKYDNLKHLKGSRHKVREGSLIKLGKGTSDGSDTNSQIGRANIRDMYDTPVGKTHLLLGRATEGSATALEPVIETPSLRKEEVSLRRHSKETPNLLDDTRDTNTHVSSGLDPQPKDSKPLLKLKFKNPYMDNQSSWVPQGEEEKSAVKGQRSKRKRPSPLLEKTQVREVEDDREAHQDATLDEVMDVNWILKKLGKDAIGKRVEVHQASDSSWHKGVVADVVERSSALTVHLDDGRTRSLELGKQGIRFVTQKQKRSKK